MEIIRVEFAIKGIVPILFDRFHGLPEPPSADTAGYKKQAIHKLYLNDKKEICVPAANLKATIREASVELGKKMEAKKNRQKIKAQLFFEGDAFETKGVYYSLRTKKPDGIADHLVTRQAGKVQTFRPFLSEWEIKGELMLLGLPLENVRSAFDLAGFKYGLCGYRPEHGRFEVIKFEEVK